MMNVGEKIVMVVNDLVLIWLKKLIDWFTEIIICTIFGG